MNQFQAADAGLLQASEEQQGLHPSDLKSAALKEVVKAKQRAKPDVNMSIYRVHKAKGPNPMSVKRKKKAKQKPAQPVQHASESVEKTNKPARKRRKVTVPGDTAANE